MVSVATLVLAASKIFLAQVTTDVPLENSATRDCAEYIASPTGNVEVMRFVRMEDAEKSAGPTVTVLTSSGASLETANQLTDALPTWSARTTKSANRATEATIAAVIRVKISCVEEMLSVFPTNTVPYVSALKDLLVTH